MSYNPRIKNLAGGIVDLSGSVIVSGTIGYVSASSVNATTITANSVSASSIVNSTVDVSRTLKTNIRKVSGSTSMSTTDHTLLVSASSSNITISLPSASLVPAQQFVIKKTDSTSNSITLTGVEKDPLTYSQTSVLTGSLATSSSDYFGYSLSINASGNRMVVGAYQDERSGAAAGFNSGNAYVLVKKNSTWTQEALLVGTLATGSSDYFGFSVSMNSIGDRLVVGAYSDEPSGQPSNRDSGIAYVFVSESGGWTQQAALNGTLATASGDWLGYSVSMNSAGDRFAVGALNDERTTGNANIGLVYIFISGSGGWTQSAILSGTLAVDTSDEFGRSVSINAAGDRLVVGSRQDEKSGGNPSMGLVYTFISGSNGWSQEQILSGSYAVDTSDYFGSSVAMNSQGNRIVIGAEADEITGNPTGLAYVFVSGSNGWSEEKVLSGAINHGASDGGDQFGVSVHINGVGNRIIVGAIAEEITSSVQSLGRAYVFTSGTNGWNLIQTLSGSLAVDANDFFGQSVAMNSEGNVVVVGAHQDELYSTTGSTGITYVFASSELVDFSSHYTLSTQNDSITLISDGSGSWSTI